MQSDAKKMTGRKVLAIAVGAFAAVVCANMALVWAATGSFPGLVVKNSYVASQGWNARTEAQDALGWQAAVGHDGGRLVARIEDAEGRPVEGLTVAALVGRPARDDEDRTLALAADGETYAGEIALGEGLWMIDLTAEGPEGAAFEAVARIDVDAGDR